MHTHTHTSYDSLPFLFLMIIFFPCPGLLWLLMPAPLKLLLKGLCPDALGTEMCAMSDSSSRLDGD